MKNNLITFLLLFFSIVLNCQEVLVSAGAGYGGYNQDLAWDQSVLAAMDCNANVTTIATMPTAADIAGKDVVFVSAPDSDFSAGATAEMANLLAGGGVLFFIGEHGGGFQAYNMRIDLLIGNLGSTMFNLNNIINSQCNNAGFEFVIPPNNSCIMQGIDFWQSQALSAIDEGAGTALMIVDGQTAFAEEAVGGGRIFYISDVNWLEPPSCPNDHAITLITNMICGCLSPCVSSLEAIEDTIEFCQMDTVFTLDIDTSTTDLSAEIEWSATNGGVAYMNSTDVEDPIISIPSSFSGTIIYTANMVGDSIDCEATDSVVIIVNPLPDPQIMGAPGVCINGAAYNLTGTPLGGIWEGDVDGLGGVDPALLGVGNYEAIYTVTENGCSVSDTQAVEIYDTTTILIAPLTNPYCISAGIQVLNAFPTGGTWSAPVIGNAIDPVTLGQGIHDLTYSYTNADGCSTESTIRMEVIDEVQSQIIGPDALCQDGGVENYIGIFPGGVWGGAANAIGEVDPASLFTGTHMITYSSPPALCNIADTLWIEINEPPSVAVDSHMVICATGTKTLVNFDDHIVSGDFDGIWIDLNGSGAKGDFPELDFGGVSPGSYSFVYRSQSAEAPCVEAEAELIVMVPPRINVIDYIIIPLSCESHTDAMIDVTVGDGVGPFMYSLNGSTLQSEAEFDFLEPGNYELVIVDGFGCPFRTMLSIPDRPDWDLELGTSVILDEGEETTVIPDINLVDSLISDYYWTMGEDTICFQCENLSFVPDSSGFLVLEVTDIFGCVELDSINIRIEPDEKIYLPTVFSPNGDNVNDVWYIQGDQSKVEVIDFLYIYDRWGSMVFAAENFPINSETYGWNGRFEGKELNSSVYTYHIRVKYKSGTIQEMTGDFTAVK